MRDSRALSPLIATVVFIAFIVAFLALVISAINTLTGHAETCDMVAVEAAGVCSSGGELRIAVSNAESATVAGFDVEVATGDGLIEERFEEELSEGRIGEYTLQTDSQVNSVTITPLLSSGEDIEPCSTKSIELTGQEIGTC